LNLLRKYVAKIQLTLQWYSAAQHKTEFWHGSPWCFLSHHVEYNFFTPAAAADSSLQLKHL
jgi:hypothetical protein